MQQLRRAAQAAEGILDFVGQPAHQLLGRQLLGMLLLLLTDLLLLVDLAQLHHQQTLFMVGHRGRAQLHQSWFSLYHQSHFAVGKALP